MRPRTFRLKEAGDSALLFEIARTMDRVVNAAAIDLARAFRGMEMPGIRDVIPTYGSVTIHFDPFATDVERVRAAMSVAAATGLTAPDGRLIEVPVAYGGDSGPDLAAVAAAAGLSIEEVINRHSTPEYRVFMLGFLPGYAYMGIVDKAIAVPRRATPRTHVPGGSVAIAGRQTGIYPRRSPGGWHVIGRTALRLFEESREPSSLFAPGDRVRFLPVPESCLMRDAGVADERPVESATVSRRAITVLRGGLQTTIQDGGRWGHQDRGVPVAGPMDPIAHRFANVLVGNTRDDAAFEATMLGPDLRFEQTTLVAVTGGDLSASVDGTPLPMNTPRSCAAGSVMRFGERRRGARAYIACNGGIAVPPVLGSRATDTLGGLGGLAGRALAAGDRVPLGEVRGEPPSKWERVPPESDASQRPTVRGGARLRIMRGPQDDHFDETTLESIDGIRLTVSPESDRVGYRLKGLAVPVGANPAAGAGEMISDAAFTGGLQITPSGQSILLMANRQTTGGYPQIGTVITADLSAAGQLAPGDSIQFEWCTRAEAITALTAQEEWIRALE